MSRTVLLPFALVALAAAARAQLVFETPAELVTTPALVSTTQALGDLDGDGLSDLVVHFGGDLDQTRVFLNSGAAGLGVPDALAPQSLGDVELLLDLGDLDGDGALDLVFAGPVSGGPPMRTALGAGDGTFASALDTGATLRPDLATLADLDADGDLDIVSVATLTQAFVSLHMGAGDGTFTAGQALAPAGGFLTIPLDLRVGDLDGDGIDDIASAHLDGTVRHFAGLGGGAFASTSVTTVLGVPALFSGDLVLADLDSDGTLDAISALGNQVSVRLNSGSGAFGAPTNTSFTGTSPALDVRDVDDDGQLDVCVGTIGDVPALHVLRGAGDGSLTRAASVTTSGPTTSTLALDLDEDGRPDLVSLQLDTSPSFLRRIELLHNVTYLRGAPWADLGGSHPGSVGYAILIGEGTLTSNSFVQLELSNGPVGTSPYLVAGLSRLDAPFKGGLLVPQPDALIALPSFDSEGRASVVAALHAVPLGFELFLQAWFADAGASQGWAASTGVQASLSP